MTAHTVNIILETGEYFVATLDNGGARLGMRGGVCFDFPANDPELDNVLTLTEETVEEAYDYLYAARGPAL